ncbi:B22R family protein [Penguinpox virus]|uniref:B22R family protein n=1 Tax=Penguinpox virus TaxID=648998 RepID=A0A068EF20_9POXV|nr:B22R family protein [Penguinpox virus]AID46859.1 B22R family protein [Penguinpox virus]
MKECCFIKEIIISILFYSLIFASYIDDSENDSCLRKESRYHSTVNYVKPKELLDHKAIAAMRYLTIVKTRELERFHNCFNWKLIREKIKYNFINMCNKRSAQNRIEPVYMYNYTYSVSLHIHNRLKNRHNYLTNGLKLFSCISAASLSLSKEDIEYTNCETRNNVLTCSVPYMHDVTFSGDKCKNITVDKVIVRNFTMNKNKDSSTITVTFKGVSSSPPYEPSNVFAECVKHILLNCQKTSGRVGQVMLISKMASNCHDCQMSLMVDVVPVPEEFNTSLVTCGGMTYDKLARLYYTCEVTDGVDCINYIYINDKIKSNSIKTLRAYTGKKIRSKRDTNEDKSTECSDNISSGCIDTKDSFINYGHLNCMYNMYHLDDIGKEYQKCIEYPNNYKEKEKQKLNISSSRRRRKRSIEDSLKDVRTLFKDYLGIDSEILKGVTHLQVGMYKKQKGISGDGEIVNTLKDIVKSKFRTYMPIISSDTLPKDVLNILDIPLPRLEGKNIVSSSLSSISFKKIESIKSAIKNNKHSHRIFTEYLDKLERRLNHIELNNKQHKKVISNFKNGINAYKESGGRAVSVVATSGESILGVEVRSVISKPLTERVDFSPVSGSFDTKVYKIQNNYKPVEPLYTYHKSIKSRCKRGIGGVCGLLSLTHSDSSRRRSVASSYMEDINGGSIDTSQDLYGYYASSRGSRINSGTSYIHSRHRGSSDSINSILSRYNSGNVYSTSRVNSDSANSILSRYSTGSIYTDGSSNYIIGSGYPMTDYGSKMDKMSKLLDKTVTFNLVSQLLVNRLMDLQIRYSDDSTVANAVAETVSTSLESIGGVMSIVGSFKSVRLGFSGMGLTTIAGLIDTGVDIYHILTGKPRSPDPVIKTFNMYEEFISDTERAGVRKCMIPGTETLVYMSYRNDTSFKQPLEKLSLYFIDTIDSVLMYLNTSNVVLDFSLTVACPLGYLRSIDVDITAYTTLKHTNEYGVRFYKFLNLGAMLSSFPTVRLTCGKDITLTLKPFEVKLRDMQLLKMATPGEPEETKNMPSNVCDLFPMKNFYLLVSGCPFDSSITYIIHTTCSILLRIASWEPVGKRWILESPFGKNSGLKQIFVFQKRNFSDIIIKPNTVQGHSKFCANKHTTECYWKDVMILDDTSSCAYRSRNIYVEIYTFGDGRGFTSFVLTCPSGSTPVAVGDKDGVIELPIGDFYTSKMFASTKENKIGVFCVDNYDSEFKSDIIYINFVSQVYNGSIIFLDEFTGKERVFEDMAKLGTMPWRSRKCVTWQHKRSCISYHGNIDIWTEDYIIETDIGDEIMITEKYDAGTIDVNSIEKSKLWFPCNLEINYYINDLGKAYDDSNRFWTDAKSMYRTYSSIVLVLIPCTMRSNMLIYNNSDIISSLAYHQSMTQDYGNGEKYILTRVSGSNCFAELELNSRMMKVTCDPFSIPRTIHKYEGICSITVTSRDHCASLEDDIKTSGYSKERANTPRYCEMYIHPAVWEDPDHYCGYFSKFRHIGYRYPKYEACRSYIHIYYKDTWIEREVLSKPPYAFEFTYDKNNEYVDPKLSDSLKRLYEEYRSISEYKRVSLPSAINRLSESLTSNGRSITEVIVNGKILETAYKADAERLNELEHAITMTAQEVIAHSLSAEDVKDIIENKQKCCLINFKDNIITRLDVLSSYYCGEIDDYIYDDFIEYSNMYNDQIRPMILINGTLEDFNLLYEIGEPVVSCIEATVIPLQTKTMREETEETILLRAFKEGLEELMYELDMNISTILMKHNITSLTNLE